MTPPGVMKGGESFEPVTPALIAKRIRNSVALITQHSVTLLFQRHSDGVPDRRYILPISLYTRYPIVARARAKVSCIQPISKV